MPQTEATGKQVVSFGLPFPPNVLDDHRLIGVADVDGVEVPAFTRPLAHWWIDEVRGAIRSVLIQFEMNVTKSENATVRISWDAPPATSRSVEIPAAHTQHTVDVDGHSFQLPNVLALLSPEWLCSSWLVWQQIPASENDAAPWFDDYLLESLPGSYVHITADGFAPHLFDRAAAYVKAYVRHGNADMLLAAYRSADFYVHHLGSDGFFARKPGDYKYIYTEGPALLYLLTGDPRYSEAVTRGVEGWSGWGRIEYSGEGFWTERHAGFGLLAHLHAYELSGEPELLEKARRFFEGVYRMQVEPLHGGPPDGAWLRRTGHEREPEEGEPAAEHWLTSPWMSAFLVDGIWKLWMLTDDERCPASLAMYARFIQHRGLTDDGTSLLYLATGEGLGESMEGALYSHNVEGVYLLALGTYLFGRADENLRVALERLWPPVILQNANLPPRRFTWTFRETSLLVWLLQDLQE